MSQHDWKPRLSQQKKCSRSLLRVVSRNDACEVEQSSPIALSTFWLGVFPGLSTEMIDYMIQSINEFIESKIK